MDARSTLRRAGILVAVPTAAVAAVAGWAAFVRPWLRRWGATDEEIARPMPGDELIQAARHRSTRAITIRARPDEIWPWLVQMGSGRGGLYSVDLLDQMLGVIEGPSAERVLPEWQELKPGDVIPIGGTPGWPVHAVERDRSLVLRIEHGEALATQSWGLYPIDPETTRLVLRVRGAAAPGLRTAALVAVIEPQELVMVRAQLLGIRRRAEQLADARRAAARARPPDGGPA